MHWFPVLPDLPCHSGNGVGESLSADSGEAIASEWEGHGSGMGMNGTAII